MANLVPLSKSSLIKPKSSAIIKADKFLAPKSSAIVKYSDKSSQTLEGDGILNQIQKKVIKIDKLLKSSLLLKKKGTEKKRVSTEQTEFEEREKELEKNKPKAIPGIKLPSLPKLGIFDWIKNFITQTLLGFVFVRLYEHLPKLLKLVPIIFKAGEFLIDIGGKLLDGLVTFIDWGYKAYDATRGFVKNIFGEGGVKQFDNLMSTLNKLSSVIILASLAAAMPGGPGGGGKGGGRGGRGGGGRKGLYETRNARRGVSRVDTTDGINYRRDRTTGNVQASGSKLSDIRIDKLQKSGRLTFDGKSVTDMGFQQRKGRLDVIKKYADRFGRDAALKRFGEQGVSELGGKYARSGATRFGRNALVGLAGKGGAKAILGTVRPLLKRLPIIGALIDFGLSVALGESLGRAAFKSIGAGLLGTVGAAIGSVVPVAGNIVGGIIGGMAGDAIGGALYDMFFGGKKPQQQKGQVAKAAGGGKPTTRGGRLVSGPARRTLKKKKKTRTLSFTPRKIKPGASVGGEEKVRSVFPNPEKAWWDPFGLFAGKQPEEKPEKPKGKQTNPQEFLVDSNDTLGRSNFFGPFFTLAIKSVLGQKPDQLDYKNAGKGLNTWVNTTFKSGTFGFAGGGEVDASEFFSGEDYTNVIAKSVEDSVSKEVETTIRNLSKELSLRPVGKEEMIQDNIRRGTEEGGGGGGGGAQYGSPEMRSLLEVLAHAEGTSTNRGGATGPPGYSTWAGYQIHGPTDLTTQTIQQVHDLQTSFMRAGKTRVTGSAVVGRYQFKDLKAHFAKQAGLSGDDLFSPANQDKMAIKEIERAGVTTEKLKNGGLTTQVLDKLAPIWASLPYSPKGGKSYYGQAYKNPDKLIALYNKQLGIAREQAKTGASYGSPGKMGDLGVITPETGGKYKPSVIGTKLAGDLGDFMKSWGGVTGSIWQHSRHGGQRSRPYGSYHNVDRAIDLGSYGPAHPSSGGRDEQAPILKKIIEWSKKNGVNPVQVIHGSPAYKNYGKYESEPNAVHSNHVHVAYEKGGETLDGPHMALIGEKGKEFVIDADSTAALEGTFPGFLAALNEAKYNDAIQVLRNFVSYEQPYAEPEVHYIEVPVEVPVPMPMGGGGLMMAGGGGIDNRYDTLEML